MANNSRGSTFVVKGQIRNMDGSPAASLLVKAFDKDMRGEELLGETTTDERGAYQITYTAEQFSNGDNDRADLIIRVFDSEGSELGASEVRYNAPAEATIDLVVELLPRTESSEYEQLLAEITPLLEGVPLAELTDHDIAFLAAKTGIERNRLEELRQAAQLSHQTDLPTEVFYAFARHDLPLDLKSLLSSNPDTLRDVLETAIKRRMIPASLLSSLPDIMARLAEMKSANTPVSELAAISGVELPTALLSFLDERGIHTLADIRARGGIARIEGLPVSQDDAAVETLEAQARLSVLPGDPSMNAQLMSAGYKSLSDIAGTPRETFVDAFKDQLSPDVATIIHSAATMQASSLNNLLTELDVRRLNGSLKEEAAAVLEDVCPKVCGCKDCENVTSALAYLADLLDYTLRHLKQNGKAVTLTSLEKSFHQPFRDLPAKCELMDQQVRQVRICIEVLRQYLPAQYGKSTPQWYLETAYTMLLERHGTSFNEIRRARNGHHVERIKLAERLGFALRPSRSLPTHPDELDLLLLDSDPNAPASQLWPVRLSEESLEQLFGLRDTNRPPLAGQVSVPALLHWRMDYLQNNRWPREDWVDTPPSFAAPFIDPDIVDSDDINDTVVAGKLLNDRSLLLQITQDEMKHFIEQSGFDLLLQDRDTTGHPLGGFGPGQSIADLIALRDKRDKDKKDISGDLQNLQLSEEAFDYLVFVAELYQKSSPILSQEWDNVTAILLQRWKQNKYTDWRKEEQKAMITLSPDYFRLRSGPPFGRDSQWQPKPWRSSPEVRQKWEDILRARIEQVQALKEHVEAATNAVEDALLVELRNELLRIAFLPSAITLEKLRELTQRLQIDLQADICQMTTRAAQAIETIQGLLFGTRNGLLDNEGFTLDAPNFDEEWKWLGSYATWRAAMQVFLYPENALRPTLRRRQSPAFTELVDGVRTLGMGTPENVREAALKYEQYFQDVCNLTLQACAQGSSLLADDQRQVDFTYLIARSTVTGNYYFSYIDPQPADPADAQSFWEEIPILKPLDSVFGAVCYEPSYAERFLYVFGRLEEDEKATVAFTRRRLAPLSGWDKLTPLALPNYGDGTQATGFFVARLKRTSKADPPRLSIWLTPREGYERSLNRKGTAWEQKTTFQRIQLPGSWKHLGPIHSLLFNADFACTSLPIQARFTLAGDFDHDGMDEILVAPDKPGTEGNDLWVMKYDSTSRTWQHLSPSGHPFEADLDCSSSPYPARFAVVGDFDGDGQKEIAISLAIDRILIRLTRTTIESTFPNFFWVRKFNPATRAWTSLGKPDSSLPSEISDALPDISVNEIAFRAADSNQLIAPEAAFAVAGDFNGDGRAEIAIGVKERVSGKAFLWVMALGKDEIWRNLPNLVCSTTDRTYPNFAVVGDFNKDGRDEIAVAKTYIAGVWDATSANDFWVMRFNESGAWESLNVLDCDGAQVAARFGVAGDFDGDGIVEIAVAKDPTIAPPDPSRGNEFWVAKMGSNGAWTFLPQIKCSTDAVPAQFALAGDFDGDGFDELAIARATGAADGKDFWIADWNPNTNTWDILTNLNASAGYASTFKGGVVGRFSDREANAQIAISGQYSCFYALEFDVMPEAGLLAPCSVSGIWPDYTGSSYAITAPGNDADRNQLKARNSSVFKANASLGRASRTYIEEAFFFVPMELALRLRENGYYTEALDWLRSLYDYERPIPDRKIAYKLVLDEQSGTSFDRYANWLRDPLNPHAIAETRKNSYTRFTILAIVRCLLDFADAEFTRATSESVERARALYEEAVELLDLPEIKQSLNACADKIAEIRIQVGEKELLDALNKITQKLFQIRNYKQLTAVVDRVKAALGSEDSLADRLAAAQKIVLEAQPDLSPTLTYSLLLEQNATTRKRAEVALLAEPKTERFLLELGKVAAGAHRSESYSDTLSATDTSYRGAIILDPNLPLKRAGGYIPAPILCFCVPPNPAIQTARIHAETNLHKIQTCRNIAGMQMRLDPYALPTLAEAGLQSLGSGNGLPALQPPTLQPLPYRYVTLIERARQLVQLAQQVEASMLASLQSKDHEEYELLKARQDLELAQAGQRLKELQVVEATDGTTLAALQRDRAKIQGNHYKALIAAGPTLNEHLAVGFLYATAALYQTSAALKAAAAWSVDGLFKTMTTFTGAVTPVLEAQAQATSALSQVFSTYANYERREQEWQLSSQVADQDVRIGEQQILQAQDRVKVANQDRAVSALQVEHAGAMVDFIANKFTNPDLYDWMSSVLEQVYRFFLNEATSIAKLAEAQLAFERQEIPPAYIQADYWEPPSANPPPASTQSDGAGQTTNVRGLTGAERLLQDIYQLDQYAFKRNQRKLQLSKTISLAQRDPFAFQRFRESGVLNFATAMDLFDRDFPGHYLRLIKRVRTSVIALIPPTQGIRAMLSTTGTSRVIIGPAPFQRVVVQRGPESVALTSAINATGLFELDQQADLLVPFEGIGVDTTWELRMPRPANPFDYNTIADVLITIEYTALNSYDYQQQVLEGLGQDRRMSADRAFSFRTEFADAWYDLHNPELVEDEQKQMVVTFKTERADFPPNLDDDSISIKQIVLYFAHTPGKTFEEIQIAHLQFKQDGNTDSVETVAEGVFSTRTTAFPQSWETAILGQKPFGEWELSFNYGNQADDNKKIRDRFKNEKDGKIEDILFIITYEGNTAEWPT